MSGNATARFTNVALLSVTSRLPAGVRTSAEVQERLAPALRRLRLPSTLLQRVAGVHERRAWSAQEDVDAATVAAGQEALHAAGVDPSDVGLASPRRATATTSSRNSFGWGLGTVNIRPAAPPGTTGQASPIRAPDPRA